MNAAIKEVLSFVEENDVKFIRLAFCDLFGVQKNISIMPSQLEEAFNRGIPFDACAVNGFSDIKYSDLFLYPDPATLSVLPWRPQQGRVVRFFCSIKNPDGTEFSRDTRNVLIKTLDAFSATGYETSIGMECEFYLFQTDENGMPTKIPLDEGGYLDIAPIDKGENVRREICLTLEEMGILPESSHHEQGPGQNEIDFKFATALISADNFLTFKSVVKTVASRNGLFASFMPKPLEDKSGNGLHINISLLHNGKNIFKDSGEGHSPEAEHFIAGILNRIAEITAFLNPIENSYKRIGFFQAPKYVSWSRGNRSHLIRIPYTTKEKVRMELRSADSSANPYLALALLISAGFEGIREEMPLMPPVELESASGTGEIKTGEKLPQSLDEALGLARDSAFIQSVLGREITEVYLNLKNGESAQMMNQYFKIL